MKTAEALDRIAIVTMDHLSKDVIVYTPSKLRLEIQTILESYAKEHAIELLRWYRSLKDAQVARTFWENTENPAEGFHSEWIKHQ